MKKVLCILCVVCLCIGLFGTVSASAAETATLVANYAWPYQEANFSVTVGCSYAGTKMGGATIEVTYNATYFEYDMATENNLGNQTDGIAADTPGLIRILFYSNSGSTSFQQQIGFKVKSGVAVGSKGDISVKAVDLSDTMGEVLACAGTPVSKTITVVLKPTPTPTPKPTPTPTYTPTPKPTEEVTETPSEEPTELTPEPTEEIVITQKPTTVPTQTPDSQALLIKTGALGFWMMVVLIAGIWVGIAIGYFIWGRKKGRNVRRSKIIGNDEF